LSNWYSSSCSRNLPPFTEPEDVRCVHRAYSVPFESVYIFAPCFSKIHFNIILPFIVLGTKLCSTILWVEWKQAYKLCKPKISSAKQRRLLAAMFVVRTARASLTATRLASLISLPFTFYGPQMHRFAPTTVHLNFLIHIFNEKFLVSPTYMRHAAVLHLIPAYIYILPCIVYFCNVQ
jgi:hypothetical protein